MSFEILKSYIPYYKRNLKVALPVMFTQLGAAMVGLALTFPLGLGAKGMWIAFVVALAIPAVLFHIRFNRRMKKMSKYENEQM